MAAIPQLTSSAQLSLSDKYRIGLHIEQSQSSSWSTKISVSNHGTSYCFLDE
jgi:hypothetical protein